MYAANELLVRFHTSQLSYRTKYTSLKIKQCLIVITILNMQLNQNKNYPCPVKIIIKGQVFQCILKVNVSILLLWQQSTFLELWLCNLTLWPKMPKD